MMQDKRKSFLAATRLHAAEGELFGMTQEQVATALLGHAVLMHIESHGREATTEALKMLAEYAAGYGSNTAS